MDQFFCHIYYTSIIGESRAPGYVHNIVCLLINLSTFIITCFIIQRESVLAYSIQHTCTCRIVHRQDKHVSGELSDEKFAKDLLCKNP